MLACGYAICVCIRHLSAGLSLEFTDTDTPKEGDYQCDTDNQLVHHYKGGAMSCLALSVGGGGGGGVNISEHLLLAFSEARASSCASTDNTSTYVSCC